MQLSAELFFSGSLLTLRPDWILTLDACMQGQFYGNSSAFVFRLLPTAAIFHATGINDNYQWCGVNFGQLPNGIGFGGQVPIASCYAVEG